MIERHPFHIQLPQQIPSLRHRALKLTASVHRADDLVQATLLKAWANRERYIPETNLRAWLFTILRNTFFSELRKYRREIEDINGNHAGRVMEEPRQQAVLELKELLSVMQHLPNGQRQAILLMSAYGFSQLEAATACQCTVGTIKSRVSRGRAALHDYFGDGLNGPTGALVTPVNLTQIDPALDVPHMSSLATMIAAE